MASSYFNAGVLSLFLILSVQKPTNANRLIQVIDMDQRQSLTPAQAAAISRIPVLEQQVERNTAGTEEVALLKQSIEDMKAAISKIPVLEQQLKQNTASTEEVAVLKQSIEDMKAAISRIPVLEQQVERNTAGTEEVALLEQSIEDMKADILNQTGEMVLFKQSIENIKAGLSQCATGSYSTGTGGKKQDGFTETKRISYGRTFSRTPKVVASVAGFYRYQKKFNLNWGLKVEARSPATTHFDLYMEGFLTDVYHLDVSWIACP